MIAARTEPIQARRFTRVEYERMGTAGLFEDERVELIRGVIIQMNARGPTHDGVIARLNKLLVPALGDRATVRIQSAFAASRDSQPEPDVAVVPVRADDLEAHPTEAFLIIEVADSSLLYDRSTKAELYAESGVPEYWIVDLVHGLVEVHTEIVDGRYTRLTPHRPGDTIQPRAFEDLSVPVASLVR